MSGFDFAVACGAKSLRIFRWKQMFTVFFWGRPQGQQSKHFILKNEFSCVLGLETLKISFFGFQIVHVCLAMVAVRLSSIGSRRVVVDQGSSYNDALVVRGCASASHGARA